MTWPASNDRQVVLPVTGTKSCSARANSVSCGAGESGRGSRGIIAGHGPALSVRGALAESARDECFLAGRGRLGCVRGCAWPCDDAAEESNARGVGRWRRNKSGRWPFSGLVYRALAEKGWRLCKSAAQSKIGKRRPEDLRRHRARRPPWTRRFDTDESDGLLLCSCTRHRPGQRPVVLAPAHEPAQCVSSQE